MQQKLQAEIAAFPLNRALLPEDAGFVGIQGRFDLKQVFIVHSVI